MCGRAGEWEPKVENIVVRIWGKNQIEVHGSFWSETQVFVPHF